MFRRLKRLLLGPLGIVAVLFVGSVLSGPINYQVILLALFVLFIQRVVVNLPRIANLLVPLRQLTLRADKKGKKYINASALPTISLIVGMYSVQFGLLLLAATLFILYIYLHTDIHRILFHKAYSKHEHENIQNIDATVALYIAGPPGAAYQVNQWLPVLNHLDQNCIIVTRNVGIYKNLFSTEIPVIYARTAKDVESLFNCLPDLKVVLYPANPLQNVQAFRHAKLTHVFINHGESDKVVNQSKLLMAYDKLFMAGKLSYDRLVQAGLPVRDNQVVYVGRPQAELALNVVSNSKPIKTVLYAPTWEGFVDEANYSSIANFGLELINNLRKANPGLDITFKPHPFTGIRSREHKKHLQKIKSVAESINVKVATGDDNIHNYMNECDLLITDISSVLNEFLVTNKPIILCNAMQESIDKLHDEFPSSRAAYVLDKPSDIGAMLGSIDSEDKLSNKRLKIRSYSMGNPQSSAMHKFKAAVNELCS